MNAFITAPPTGYQGQRATGEMARGLTMRLTLFLARLDPAGAELYSALAAILFGLVLLVQPDVFTRSPAYQHLGSLAGQSVWGAIWLAAGIAQLAGLTLLVLLTGWCWRIRQAATFTATVLWVWWVWSLWSSTGLTPGVTTYLLIALGSGWGWLRAGR